MTDLRTQLTAIMDARKALGDAVAIDLMIGAVLRGVGSRGGRPKNGLQTGYKPVGEPVTNGFAEFSQLPPSSDPEEKDQDQDHETDSAEVPSEPTPEPSKAAAEPPEDTVLTFPTAGKVKRWHLSRRFVEDCREGYVGLDVEGEFRRARVWVEANPGKRKTAKGMPAFLANWLARAQNRGGGGGANGTGPPRGLHVGHVRITGNEDYGPEGEQQL